MVQTEEPSRRKPVLKVKKLRSDVRIPKRKTTEVAGYDLVSLEDITLKPGEMTIVDTGLAIAIP